MEDIKLAYRRLAAFYHPDRNSGDLQAAEMFRRVLDAYRVLEQELPQSTKNLPALSQRPPCRRKRRGTPSDRRYHWQLPEEYIGTHVRCEA